MFVQCYCFELFSTLVFRPFILLYIGSLSTKLWRCYVVTCYASSKKMNQIVVFSSVSLPTSWLLSHVVGQSASHSIRPAIGQSHCQSVHQLVSQLVSHSVSPLVSHSAIHSQSVIWSVSQLAISHAVTQSFSQYNVGQHQSVSQSVSH